MNGKSSDNSRRVILFQTERQSYKINLVLKHLSVYYVNVDHALFIDLIWSNALEMNLELILSI